MNKIIISGNLTRDPELKQTQGGNVSCRFNIGVRRNFRNANGEFESDFPSCVAWGKTAEHIAKYFKKGDSIMLEGSLRTGDYTNQQGQKIYTTDVNVDRVEFMGKKDNSAQNGYAQPASQQYPQGGYAQAPVPQAPPQQGYAPQPAYPQQVPPQPQPAYPQQPAPQAAPQGNYPPPQQSYAPQPQQAPPLQQGAPVPPPASPLNDFGDFEILGDGDVPF